MKVWTVYPAIDLRRGRVVRLMQGDPEREIKYADDALGVAVRWQASGAEWLHVVDLDSAFGEASPENRVALERILASGLQIQFGGGLRDMESLRQALDMGVSRAVIGTAAVEDPALVEVAIRAFGPERVAVAIDTCQGKVCIQGWRRSTALAAMEMIQWCAAQGVHWVILTDISRDGTGSGLDVAAACAARATGLNVIASGGVSSIEDIRRAYEAGLSGVIIGRALYEGYVKLEDALLIGK